MSVFKETLLARYRVQPDADELAATIKEAVELHGDSISKVVVERASPLMYNVYEVQVLGQTTTCPDCKDDVGKIFTVYGSITSSTAQVENGGLIGPALEDTEAGEMCGSCLLKHLGLKAR